MAKGDKEQRQSKMLDLGNKLTQKEPKFVVQEIKTVEPEVKEQKKEVEKESEKPFHLFIPMNLYWKVKETSVEEKQSMKDFINGLLLANMIDRKKLDKEGKPIK